MATAQEWQPMRLPADSSAQQLPPSSGAVRTASAESPNRPVLSSNEQLGSGMVLRWRTTAPRGAQPMEPRESTNSASSISSRTSTSSNVRSNASSTTSTGNSPSGYSAQNASDRFEPNALRDASTMRQADLDNPIRQAAYQDAGSPQWRSVNTRRQDEAPQVDQLQQPPRLGNPGNGTFGEDAPQLPPSREAPLLETPKFDLLDKPEAAPQPPAGQSDPPSFPRAANEDNSPADRRRMDSPGLKQDTAPRPNAAEIDQLLKQAPRFATPDCQTQRDLLRGQPLSSLNLNVAPQLSNRVRDIDNAAEVEALREEFQQRALRRDWTDYKGRKLVSGRMKELRHGNVVVDVDGTEQLVPLNSLSDVDMSYIADLWNLPFRCGSGFEPQVGRDFIASTVQWKASGACHNPLYFEQVQLERYGHDAGPIVQPLLSSAHFFLTIPILPYKMGINPMNECQYALGYYRPGNCAPYMMQPIPLSLRGGLAQTGAVLGMAAALP